MYRIIDAQGQEIGKTERPMYIRRLENGSLSPCGENVAAGVALDGVAYSLFATAGIGEEYPVVLVKEVDGGRLMSEQDVVNGIVFVSMAESGQIDAVTAGEHMDYFASWTYPVGYKAGQYRKYDGILYRCISPHTSQADWTPDVAVSLWVAAADPGEEWPAWSQPVGAPGAYRNGARVTHKEIRWVSDYDANNWEPGVFGWTEYVEGVPT